MSQYETLKKSIITIPKNSKFAIKKIGKTAGYDGHSLRTYYYWPDKFKHLTDSVTDVNSIADDYSKDRSASKTVTFALTFAGTWSTLVKNSGFSEKEAKDIEANYHELYEVSDKWVYDKLKQASIDGYVTLAFGTRLRTPILKQVIWDSPKMPYEASAEGRSAGNAVSGQSYGQLNCRATNELRQRIRNSPYKYKIRISGPIHDSIYSIVANEVDVVEWLNINLIEVMEWQELDAIRHPSVHMESELELYYEGWHKPVKIPNGSSQEEIIEICKEE